MQLFNVKSITDSELYSRIDRFCDILCHPIDHLNEMAYEKKELMSKLEFQQNNLFTNWVLVKYARENGGRYMQLKNHWAQEFCNACYLLQNYELKKGNDVKKMKAFREEWYTRQELNTEKGKRHICVAISSKMAEEGIVPMMAKTNVIMELLSPYVDPLWEQLDTILDLIVNDTRDDAIDYINNI